MFYCIFQHCKALIGCSHGDIFEVNLSDREGSHIDLTFHASHVQLKSLTFKSTKSEIRRNIRLQEIEAAKEGKLLKKQRSLERLRRENPEVEIDEKTFLADSDDEEELEELYIPPIGNPILWLTYAQNGMILLMVGGYDAGYVYEYDLDSLESDTNPMQPTRCTLIPQGDDIEVHSVVSL
jgi:cilia- and flagella-associated protein 44